MARVFARVHAVHHLHRLACVIAFVINAIDCRDLFFTNRSKRLRDVAVALDDTISDVIVGLDVFDFDPVAVDDDLTNQIAIMGTAVAVLNRDHGDDGFLDAVARDIGVGHEGHSRMADDGNLIFIGIVIGDYVDARAINPVVVKFIVFARNTCPIDRAIGADVLFDNVQFCIDLR